MNSIQKNKKRVNNQKGRKQHRAWSAKAIQQTIVIVTAMVVFGMVCFKLVDSENADQLLPFLAGLLGAVFNYLFGPHPKTKES